MPLSDVWTDITQYIDVYTSRTFENVPTCPGVYAWFYPIMLPSMDIEDLGIELTSILNYDSTLEGEQKNEAEIQFNWKHLKVGISEEPNNDFNPKVGRYWENISNDTNLENLKKIMLVSSILMPPLYIGKTGNLHRRCGEHRNSSSFHNRFEKFTKEKILVNKKQFLHQKVEDLIFVCIKTDMLESHDDNMDETDYEEFLEEIFKLMAKPPYGKY